MIPLVYLLLGWLILMGLFAIMTFLSVMMSLRHSVANIGTYISTGLFLIVVAGVLLVTMGYFMSVDWSQNVEFFYTAPISFNP